MSFGLWVLLRRSVIAPARLNREVMFAFLVGSFRGGKIKVVRVRKSEKSQIVFVLSTFR